MSKTRIFIWIVILAIIGIFVTQNKALFFTKQAVGIDLPFFKFHPEPLYAGIYYVIALIIGLLIAYFFSITDKWRARKTIKGLNATLDSQREELTSLKQEIETLRNKPPETPVQSFASAMNDDHTENAEQDPEAAQDSSSDTQTGDTQSETSEEDEKN